MAREQGYYRFTQSNVWHFNPMCRYWHDVARMSFSYDWVAARSRDGRTLCDYCQKAEKRERHND